MKVREQIAALAQFDPETEILPCAPEGMTFMDDADCAGPDDGSPRHFNGAWPSAPREGDTVRETGKRFGANRTWRREQGQWVSQ